MNKPTASPTQPDNPSSKFSKLKQKVSRRKGLASIIAAIVVVLIFGAIITVATGSDDTKTAKNNANSKQLFPNLLKPASEIKLGQYRYVSPCQVLPFSDVTKIFGKTDGLARTVERYIDTSRAVTGSVSNDNIDASCSYILSKQQTIALYTDQYADPEQANSIRKLLVDTDKLNDTITTLKSTSQGNADATALVTQMEKSRDGYLKYYKEFDEDVLKSANFDGYILPKSFGDSLILNYKNVVYNIQPRSKKELKELTATELANYYKAFEIIKKNANNKNLDQSPAPTLIGNSNKVGTTKIVEPCSILSKDTFKQITGKDANDIVSRTSLPRDVNVEALDKKNQPILNYNDCERGHDTETSKETIRMTIRYAKSVAAAQNYVKNYDSTPEPPATPLQTNGDEAYSYPNPFNPTTGKPLYLVRTGPYVITISYDLMDSSAGLSGDIIQTNGTQDQVVKTMNAIVDQIKKQQ